MAATTRKPKTEQVTCPRCGGAGEFKEYAGIWGGTCFKCCGSGKVEVAVKTEAAKAKAAAKKAAKEAERLAQAAACKAENDRKEKLAAEKYAGDSRLRVGPSHPYYYMHVYELAVKDKVWATL